MTTTIALAGATGNLELRIAKALRRRVLDLWALVRPEVGNDELAELGHAIERVRAADPGGEEGEFPHWQQMQYARNMMSGTAKLEPVDNARFLLIRWTTVRDLAARLLARQGGGSAQIRLKNASTRVVTRAAASASYSASDASVNRWPLPG